MNKILLIGLLFLGVHIGLAQNARRFYNSLDLIFLSPDEDKVIPNELDKITKWSRAVADNMFYANLQRNSNPRNSASFNSLDLILKRQFDFNFLDSDILISFNKDIELRETKVNVLNNNVWRIKSYNAIIDFDKFDPENMTINFYYMKILGGLSDEQMLAHFINHMDKKSSDDTSAVKQFIQTVNSSQNLTINEDLDQSKDFRLKDLCKEIKAQVPESNCTYPAYLTFIKDKNREKNISNINAFYRRVLSRTLEDVMNVELLPEGDMAFRDQNVTISLPSKFFENTTTKKEEVSFKLRELKYDVNYDLTLKSYYMTITLTPHNNSLNSDFNFESKGYSPLKGKEVKTDETIKKDQIKNFTLDVYPNYINMTIQAINEIYGPGDFYYKVSKPIKIK